MSHQPIPTEDYNDDLDQELDALDVENNQFRDEPEDDDDDEEPAVVSAQEESTGLTTTTSTATNNTTGDDDQEPLSSGILLGSVILGVVLAILLGSFGSLWILVVILLGFVVVARLTRPTKESFQVNTEIKRLGHEQQDKSKGKKNWIQRNTKKVSTFLSNTAKQALAAHDDVQFLDVGIGTVAVTRDLTNGRYLTWMGVFGKWHHVSVLSQETQESLHQHLWSNARGGRRPDPNVV